jgi:hypothetical protein
MRFGGRVEYMKAIGQSLDDNQLPPSPGEIKGPDEEER